MARDGIPKCQILLLFLGFDWYLLQEFHKKGSSSKVSVIKKEERERERRRRGLQYKNVYTKIFHLSTTTKLSSNIQNFQIKYSRTINTPFNNKRALKYPL